MTARSLLVALELILVTRRILAVQVALVSVLLLQGLTPDAVNGKPSLQPLPERPEDSPSERKAD